MRCAPPTNDTHCETHTAHRHRYFITGHRAHAASYRTINNPYRSSHICCMCVCVDCSGPIGSGAVLECISYRTVSVTGPRRVRRETRLTHPSTRTSEKRHCRSRNAHLSPPYIGVHCRLPSPAPSVAQPPASLVSLMPARACASPHNSRHTNLRKRNPSTQIPSSKRQKSRDKLHMVPGR